MTNPSRPYSPAARKRPPFRHRLHRVVGLATGLILLHLIATGLPLQLTDTLKLGSRFVTQPAVLDWYGIQPPAQAWHSNGIVSIGNQLFRDGHPVAELTGFHGAVRQGGLAIVALDSGLLIVPPEARTSPESIDLGAAVRRIGLAGNDVILDTEAGLVEMDPALLNPFPADLTDRSVTWAPLTLLSGEALTDYQALARGRILTTERLLQDLHSGRAFGTIGEWVINLATLAMTVLAFTGLLIWWRTR